MPGFFIVHGAVGLGDGGRWVHGVVRWCLTPRFRDLVTVVIEVGAWVVAEGAAPVLALFVDPAAAFAGLGVLEYVAAVEEGLFVQPFKILGDIGGDAAFADTLGDAGFPGFKGLAGFVVNDVLFVGVVDAGTEKAVELQAANLVQVLEARASFDVAVLLGDVVLGESFAVLGDPDGNVDGGVFVVGHVLEPVDGIGGCVMVALLLEFEDDGRSVAVLDGETDGASVVLAGEVVGHVGSFDMAHMTSDLATAAAGAEANLAAMVEALYGDLVGNEMEGADIPAEHLWGKTGLNVPEENRDANASKADAASERVPSGHL